MLKNGLILTRKQYEEIQIDHPDGPITIRFLGPSQRHRQAVRIAISAPETVRIMRGEIAHEPPRRPIPDRIPA